MWLPRSAAEPPLTPRHGPDSCPRCLNLTGAAGLCRACRANEQHLAAVLPRFYSVGGEWLHHVILAYKRDADPSVTGAVSQLSRICETMLASHERCVAAAASVATFQIVTTVPSADPLRDLHHPLRRILGSEVRHTRARYERLLVRSAGPAIPRVFDPARYQATRRLDGEAVLLVDDMWTSGASAESAAAALLAAGAGTVAAIVVARHLNRAWRDNDRLLRRLARDGGVGERCALCAASAPSPPPLGQATAGCR